MSGANVVLSFDPTKEGLECFLPPLEAKVMRVLWEKGPLTNGGILQKLNKEANEQGTKIRAYSTISRTTTVMHGKGLLTRDTYHHAGSTNAKLPALYRYQSAYISEEMFMAQKMNYIHLALIGDALRKSTLLWLLLTWVHERDRWFLEKLPYTVNAQRQLVYDGKSGLIDQAMLDKPSE